MNSPRIVLCEACGSEGRLQHFEGRDWHGNDLGWEEPCPYCEGTGGAIIETRPIELEDLAAMFDDCAYTSSHKPTSG